MQSAVHQTQANFYHTEFIIHKQIFHQESSSQYMIIW